MRTSDLGGYKVWVVVDISNHVRDQKNIDIGLGVMLQSSLCSLSFFNNILQSER